MSAEAGMPGLSDQVLTDAEFLPAGQFHSPLKPAVAGALALSAHAGMEQLPAEGGTPCLSAPAGMPGLSDQVLTDAMTVGTKSHGMIVRPGLHSLSVLARPPAPLFPGAGSS